jgi:mono/diheme cytochrome c family protein
VPLVIGTLVFVLIFLVVGLTVVLAAMRSGRSPSRAGSETRGTRRAWNIGIGVVILVVGLGLPLLVVVSNNEGHAKRGAGGVNLTAGQAEGRQLFAEKCSTCHTLGGSAAVGRVGPNLDTLNGGDLKTAFVLDAIEKGRARDAGQMPAGLLYGEEAKHVAEYVSAVAGR